MKRIKSILVICGFSLIFSACTVGVTIKKTDVNKRYAETHFNIINSDKLSERTERYLWLNGFSEEYKKHPLEVLVQLDENLNRESTRRDLFVLSELSFFHGKRARSFDEKMRSYASSMLYSYTYLFDNEFGALPNKFNDTFRIVCDIYNLSLSNMVVLIKRFKSTASGMKIFPLIRGRLNLDHKIIESQWGIFDFENIFLANEFKPSGFFHENRKSGIGVPLIVVRRQYNKNTDQKKIIKETKANLVHPVTMIVNIEGSFFAGSGKREFNATAKYFNSLDFQDISIDDKKVPLEINLTMPIAYALNKAKDPGGLKSLFKINQNKDFYGLYMFEPYSKGKIPLVLVHGLMSSPYTWLQMVNELMSNPDINKKYQLWFYFYPTGNHLVFNNAEFRQTLENVRSLLLENGDDKALDQMAIVAHSMGGVLSKMIVQESGNKIWNTFAGVDFNSLVLDKDIKKNIKQIFFYKPLPFISRIIFLAVPHRGAEMADKGYARITASLINLPEEQIKKIKIFLKALPEGNPLKKYLNKYRFSTGIDSLKPDNKFLKTINSIPVSKSVTCHSIIGNVRDSSKKGMTDGVVHYDSSHLEWTESEKIVKSGHSVQNCPEAIKEVMRILIMHLEKTDSRDDAK